MSEHTEQMCIMNWAQVMKGQHPELDLLFAIPNGARLPYMKTKRGKRYSPQALYLLAEGLRPGVSDIMLPVARGGYHGLFLELKDVVKTRKPTEKQAEFLDLVRAQGYYGVVCWGCDAAVEEITKYLEMKP